MGGCLHAAGADCWECFDPDDAKPGHGRCALAGCSYALDLGNARWDGGLGWWWGGGGLIGVFVWGCGRLRCVVLCVGLGWVGLGSGGGEPPNNPPQT